ncbi:MAG: phage integrase SAM-like domain-containing protein [Candidatus Pacearchaeota archaeon]
MATVKLVLRQKKNKEGAYPIAIRITKDRRTSFIHTGHHIHTDDWDSITQRVKKQHPNHARLNNYLIKKLSEASNASLELETIKTEVSSRAVKQKIKPTGGSTFFTQATLYLENLKKAGKYNQYTADKPRIKHFKEFLSGGDISFSDITVSLLERFKVFLKKPDEETGKRLTDRTIINHLVVIRSVFGQALKGEITDRKYYPFGPGKIQIKFPDSSKIGLSPEEVGLLEKVDLDHSSFEHHARNLWLFAFYLAGMRISDVLRLKWSDIQNSRLHYAMGKNSKEGSLKLPEKALLIIAQYKKDQDGKDGFIFPDLKKIENLNDTFIIQRTIAFATSRLDKYLRNHVAPAAKIEKKLTMHIARHTFGNISGERIPIQMLQKLYRHSSVTTTIGYQANFIHKDADDALNMVIDF